jgi:hypothetical protein
MAKHRTISLPEDLVSEIEKFMKDSNLGYESKAEFIKEACRYYMNLLKKGIRPRFEHINTYEDHIKILDNEINRIVSVYLIGKDKKLWCDYCGKNDCVHVFFAWEIPQAREVLEKHRFKHPKPLKRFLKL